MDPEVYTMQFDCTEKTVKDLAFHAYQSKKTVDELCEKAVKEYLKSLKPKPKKRAPKKEKAE